MSSRRITAVTATSLCSLASCCPCAASPDTFFLFSSTHYHFSFAANTFARVISGALSMTGAHETEEVPLVLKAAQIIKTLCTSKFISFPRLGSLQVNHYQKQSPSRTGDARSGQKWFWQNKPKKVRFANFPGRSPELLPEPPLACKNYTNPLQKGVLELIPDSFPESSRTSLSSVWLARTTSEATLKTNLSLFSCHLVVHAGGSCFIPALSNWRRGRGLATSPRPANLLHKEVFVQESSSDNRKGARTENHRRQRHRMELHVPQKG